MFSIKHPTSIGRPSKFLMFCRSEGEAAPSSAARCSFLCYTAAVRYRGLQTQQATDREGLGQKKPRNPEKKHGKLAEIYRNSTKMLGTWWSNSAVLSVWRSESKWPLDGTRKPNGSEWDDTSSYSHPTIQLSECPGSFFGTNHPRRYFIFVRMSWPSEGTKKKINRNTVNTCQY